LEKNGHKEGFSWEFSVKKIFFGRKIPRVEPSRASIHGTSVPWMGGGILTNQKTYRKLYRIVKGDTIFYM
jgi:hypothetical protein